VSPWGNDGHVSPRALLFMGTFLAIAVPMVLLSKKRGALDKIVIPLFTLPDDGDPGPIAAGLLDAAHATGDQLGSPDVRALFGDVARELYRLTRRAEELAQSHPPGSPEEALARRLIGLAPPLGQRLAAVAARLEALDSALGAGSEGDTARALAALDRRAAGADTRDRASLAEARHELEAALERRLAAEGERERLAAALCRLLAAVRDLYRRAAAFPLPEEPEVAALETTLRELAAA